MNSADERLIDELRRGEVGAEELLYNRYSATLMAISMRYMGRRDAAEDLLHDAFIKILGSINKFKNRGEGSLRAWMSRIVVNTALEELRRQSRNRHLPLERADKELQEEEMPAVAIPQEILLSFIAELPEGYRTVFNLFCIEGYSHREIAKELGINEKSSSSQLLRAKRLLAAKIKSYTEQHE